MHHDTITRASLAIGAVFVIAAAAFALRPGPGTSAAEPAAAAEAPAQAPPAGQGAESYENRCARCHDDGDIADWAQQHPDPRQRHQWLAEVLTSHAPPPADEREAIIEYIQQTIAAAD